MVTIVNMAFVAFVGLVLFFLWCSRFPRFPWCLIKSLFMIFFPKAPIVGPFGMIADISVVAPLQEFFLRIAKTPLNGIEWNQN